MTDRRYPDPKARLGLAAERRARTPGPPRRHPLRAVESRAAMEHLAADPLKPVPWRERLGLAMSLDHVARWRELIASDSSLPWEQRLEKMGRYERIATPIFERLCDKRLIVISARLGGPGMPIRFLDPRRVRRLEVTESGIGTAYDEETDTYLYDLTAVHAAWVPALQPFSEPADYPANPCTFEIALVKFCPVSYQRFDAAFRAAVGLARGNASGDGDAAFAGLEELWGELLADFCYRVAEGEVVMVAREGSQSAVPATLPPTFDLGWWREGTIVRREDGQWLFDLRFHDYQDVDDWKGAGAGSLGSAAATLPLLTAPPAVGAEAACRTWLAAAIAQARPMGNLPHPRGHYESEALQQWKGELSKRGFNAVWRALAAADPWISEPGRRATGSRPQAYHKK